MGALEMELDRSEESQEEVATEPEREQSTVVSRRAPNMHPDLYMAAKSGNIDVIRNLMAEDVERPVLSQKTPQLNTVLHIAASLGHSELVAAIKYDCELWMQKNYAGELAIHVATSCGHLSTLQKLVSASCILFLEEYNNDGNTPLHLALINKYGEVDLDLKTKHSKIADFLVEAHPDVSYCPNKERKSPVYMAAEAGDVEMVKFMKENAKEINVATLQRGFGIPQPFEEVKSIAHAAITGKNISEAGDVEMVKFMKENAKEINVATLQRGFGIPQPFEEVKSIAHAAITGKNIHVLDIFMRENPHRIKDRNSEGMTPLSYAASIGYLEGVQYFLKDFADYIYESDQNGFFPIHTASSRGHIKIVQEFIEKYPDSVELLNRQGQNILHVAAMRGKAKLVNYMLKMPELEMLVNQKDKDGNASLHLASKGWHPKVVSILTWDKRVDLKLLNNEGKTALDIVGRYSGRVPSYQEQLTWTALRYANVSRATSPGTTKYKFPSSKPWEAPIVNKYKDRVNTLLLVATLVATVTFAAGFTVPGGNDDSDPHKGMAKFLRHHLFQVFIISNTIAMYSSVTVVVTLIWAQLGNLQLVIASLKFALPILGLALIMVSSAFMTGSYLMVRSLNWLTHLVLIIGSFFILILIILYLPLCLPNSLTHPVFRYIVYYPFSLLIIVTKSNANDREEK